MMWHQVIVVEKSYPEDCGVDARTHEEDTDKAHHLGKKAKQQVEKGCQLAGLMHYMYIQNSMLGVNIFYYTEKIFNNTVNI